MSGPSQEDPKMVKQARQAAIVIFATMLIWVGAQVIGGQLGLAPKYAFLLDMLAGAAFIWALVVLLRVWRARQ
ncbi:DUF5337 domain-containing protein [Litoreibacter albidus]|uniref:Uncharacterized protein n=1 Tax=Litoreibacter albidus TaxID=670155 RepID=A0A1H2RXI9_9RHOB|nr:DUF5337 domain-containing protein [Litoreibacter albidus]SDW23870.1 hypothetical protein SAMN04488001_0631 [Litoreibacter albidus]